MATFRPRGLCGLRYSRQRPHCSVELKRRVAERGRRSRGGRLCFVWCAFQSRTKVPYLLMTPIVVVLVIINIIIYSIIIISSSSFLYLHSDLTRVSTADGSREIAIKSRPVSCRPKTIAKNYKTAEFS